MMAETVEPCGPALLMRAWGRINVLTADIFEADAMRAIADGDRDVIIDTSDITYLTTAGLRVFLLISRELEKSGRSLHICNLKPYIYQVFEKIGFHLIIPIHQDIPSALAAIEGRSS